MRDGGSHLWDLSYNVLHFVQWEGFFPVKLLGSSAASLH